MRDLALMETILRGIYRRYRPMWEGARLQADVAARCAGNKQGLKIEFPWEKEEITITAEDVAYARNEMAAFEAQINKLQ